MDNLVFVLIYGFWPYLLLGGVSALVGGRPPPPARPPQTVPDDVWSRFRPHVSKPLDGPQWHPGGRGT